MKCFRLLHFLFHREIILPSSCYAGLMAVRYPTLPFLYFLTCLASYASHEIFLIGYHSWKAV